MEFYDVIDKRRTVRDFADVPPDMDAIRRILSAGLKAPTNNHMRECEFIVITGKEDIASVIRGIPKTVSDKRLDFIFKSWGLSDACQRDMYRDGIPKQYQMLLNAGLLVFPLFRQPGDLLRPGHISALNAFASVWCCIENMLLAAANEGLACAFRIPLGDEPERLAERLGHPKDYVIPCYLAIGTPADDAGLPAQKPVNLDERLHMGRW